MSYKPISWSGIGLRFLFALVLVFATYNPEKYSYFHWGIQQMGENTALKLFVGIVLLIGWIIYLRATLRSLRPIGLILALPNPMCQTILPILFFISSTVITLFDYF